LLFLSAQYYSEGEAVVHTVRVMIRAKLNGKYPYLPVVWSGNGRFKPNVAFVNGNEQKVEGQDRDATALPRRVQGADDAPSWFRDETRFRLS
jgi:hypothetical protein